MFLPVLLIRDYGYAGWVVFAAPNMIGAAAVGWTLRPGQSEALVSAHRLAIRAFSIVTSAFQIFFAIWMFEHTRMRGSAWIVLALAVAFGLFMRGDAFRSIASAILALMVSLICMMPQNVWGAFDLNANELRAMWQMDVLPLAVACLFGFIFCPYLDATFHRARQALDPRPSRLAFTIGFGFFFLLMIVFTLLYARPLLEWLGDQAGGDLGNWIALHWTVQLAFTTALHWQTPKLRWDMALASIALGAGAWFLTWVIDRSGDSSELGYRLFMSFYGLVFPAYVWICMTPSWYQPRSPSRARLRAFAIAILIASPMYWLAFIEGRMMWVLPGVALVLAARFVVPKSVDRS